MRIINKGFYNMLKLKIIENRCKNGNRTLLEAPMGNMEEITQFQYNLDKLGYVVSKLDANELIIEPKDPKNVCNIMGETNKEYFIRITGCDIALKDWDKFAKLAQNAKTACELVNDFISDFRK